MGIAQVRSGSKRPPRLATKQTGLLDGAKPSEVDWQALAAIAVSGQDRGCASWVYFASEKDGAVKIGVARDPVKRRRELQCGNPRPIRIERVIYGDQITEKLLHKAFSADRVQGTIEWFTPGIRQQILDIALEIGERQMEAHIHADMAEMTAIAVETINELEREIKLGDEVRILASDGGMITKRLKVA